MAFGTGTSNAHAWAVAQLSHSLASSPMVFSWDRKALAKLMKKVDGLQRNKNKIVKAAMASGLRVTSKEIKRSIPAYTTKSVARRRVTAMALRNRLSFANTSKMKEAKKAIGVSARISKGGRGAPKGEIEGKVGSNVGMRKRTSRDRPKRGSVGIGRGNLHWYLTGTSPRLTKSGVYTGKMRRTMVVSRAWMVTKSLVLEKMKRSMAAGIKREAAKP